MTATQPLIFEKGEIEEIAPVKIQTLPQRGFHSSEKSTRNKTRQILHRDQFPDRQE
jgi:hypothetical protein